MWGGEARAHTNELLQPERTRGIHTTSVKFLFQPITFRWVWHHCHNPDLSVFHFNCWTCLWQIFCNNVLLCTFLWLFRLQLFLAILKSQVFVMSHSHYNLRAEQSRASEFREHPSRGSPGLSTQHCSDPEGTHTAFTMIWILHAHHPIFQVSSTYDSQIHAPHASFDGQEKLSACDNRGFHIFNIWDPRSLTHRSNFSKIHHRSFSDPYSRSNF